MQARPVRRLDNANFCIPVGTQLTKYRYLVVEYYLLKIRTRYMSVPSFALSNIIG